MSHDIIKLGAVLVVIIW